MARNGSFFCGVLCVLAAHVSPVLAQVSSTPAQLPPQFREIFEASDGWNTASSAVDDLRHDASNASSAPQLVNIPGFPPSLPKWNAAKAGSPAQARLLQPCVDLLLRSLDELKFGSGTLNARVKRATALIYQADACIAKANRDGDPATEKKIQDAALAQKPRRNPDLFGGNASADDNAGNAGKGRTPSTSTPTTGRFSSISTSGCPYPPDIDPNNMSPLAPPEARVYDAENAFHQRVSLCEQQRGYLVPGGCASVCMGDGGKGMNFKRTPTARNAPASLGDLTQAVDKCFSASDPDYRSPDWGSFKGASRLKRGEGPLELSFLLTGYAASHAMSRFEVRRGKKLPDWDWFRAGLTGWITRCLVDGKRLPEQDSRTMYIQFLGVHERAKVQNSTRALEMMNQFSAKYGYYPNLYPLSPDENPF